MTNKEAHTFMEDLQRIFTQYRFMFSDKLTEANGLAILALEKQMEQKKGKWILCENPIYFCDADPYLCTVCNMKNNRQTKYCPNCGAKMEGEK